ncbi:MAG: proprotein convertase P-domain-containing protein, partial [Actinomycetota bacterium]|nr:proprotein convertase P-domain-containing protein [Actinomycetota bacterium]
MQVEAGRFEVRLGSYVPMSTDLFATYGALWLGVSVEGEPELPRRPMGSTPYARHAGSAASLACSGCVEAEHLSAGLQEALASATITAADLPGDGLNEVSGGMLTTEFHHALTSDVSVPIKDYNPLGVTSTIAVPDVGVAMALSVTVHVTNSDLTTLTVSLEDPAGGVHMLWHESGPGDVLQGTYPAPNSLLSGDLAAWVGQNAEGAWTLTAIDHGFDNLDTDGEIVSWSVAIETQSNQQAQVTGDLLVDGSVRIGPDDALCDPSREGTVRYDGVAKRLYLCTGQEWIQLRGCSEVCTPPGEAPCGEAITNDCGNHCSGPGTGLSSTQCALGATTTPCGQAVTDSCGNQCGT